MNPGDTIGAYKIIRALGKGGMGTVYEVEHTALGVHYALKTFSFDPDRDSAEVLKQKFLEEGKILARLKHPNLTHVFDLAFEETTQTPYFVMDLVKYSDGESYTVEDIDISQISEEMVFFWFKSLASALDYIHAQGIVHRDIKPSNLLIDENCNPVLTDFGISRIFGQRIKSEVDAKNTMVTETVRGKLVLGTEKYMAPEVEEGEDATPEADAYALGVMTLRWLTGFYYSDNPGAIALLSKKKYRWLSVLPAMLAASPDRRPKTYSDLVKRLMPIAEEPPANAVPPPSPQTPAAMAKRRRRTFIEWLIAGASGLLVLILVGVIAFIGYKAWQRYDADKKARDEQIKALRGEIADAKKRPAEVVTNTLVTTVEKVIVKETPQSAAHENAEPPAASEPQPPTASEPPPPAEPEPPKDTFILVDSPKEATPPRPAELGSIPDVKYKWVAGGRDNPLPIKFQLANGAAIDFIPRKPGTYYAPRDWRSDTEYCKVTLTYPFWIGKYCITAEEWREFDEAAVRDCLPVEKALKGEYPVYMHKNRRDYENFCKFLTEKYHSQLPKGYVFRLATIAELDYAADWEATLVENDFNCDGPFNWDDAKPKEEFARIRKERKLDAIREWSPDGKSKTDGLEIGGRTKPCLSGLIDYQHYYQMVFDTVSDGREIGFSEEEVNPLRWNPSMADPSLSGNWSLSVRGFHDVRGPENINVRHAARLVIGPDLVEKRVWERCRVAPKEDAVKVPFVRYAWMTPGDVPNRITKPKEVRMRLAGGGEMVFCTVPRGKFEMENPPTHKKPTHKVEITRPYWMTKYCVTIQQWREFAQHDCEGIVPRTLEKAFHDYPVCVSFSRNKWDAYCRFLNKRYGHLLPKGYEFRLPTEAEYEWALLGEKNACLRDMDLRAFYPHMPDPKKDFEGLWEKRKLPKFIPYNVEGLVGCREDWRRGRFYVGGRTSPSVFGIHDFIVPWREVFVLDTFDILDIALPDGKKIRDQAKQINAEFQYNPTETDPVRYAGRLAQKAIKRRGKDKNFVDLSYSSFAHIVVAPALKKVADIEMAETAPYPNAAYGGILLNANIKGHKCSSMRTNAWNNRDRTKSMFSTDSILDDVFVRGKQTRGFFTDGEKSPWMQVALDETHEISGITLDALSGGAIDRIAPLCVWASEDGEHFREVFRDDASRYRYAIDLQGKGVKAKFLRFGRQPEVRVADFYFDKLLIYGK